MTFMFRTIALGAAITLAACQVEEGATDVDPAVVAAGQAIAARLSANPNPGAGVTVQSVEAQGKLVRATVRIPENDPGSDFFSFDGRQTEVVNALTRVACDTPEFDTFYTAQGVVQAYIDDADGDRVATIFPSNCAGLPG